MLNRILNAFGLETRAKSDGGEFQRVGWDTPAPIGAYVSPGSVFSNLPTAMRCISLRSELLSTVPLKMYRRTSDGQRERVTDHPLADVLADLANPRTTAMEAREFLVRSLDVYGNAYAILERNGAGQVTAMWPVEANKVVVEQLETGRLRYRVTGTRGANTYLQEDVLHVRAASDDSILGVSPLTRARGALGLAIDQNHTAQNIAANGMKIAGVIQIPGRLSEQARRNMKESFEKDVLGPSNAGRVSILEDSVKFVPIQFSAADSEMLESRKLSAEDVCRIFGVPPESVGITNSVSYGSSQTAAANLIQNALGPLAVRVEQAIQRCCLSAQGRRTYIIEHDLAGLLRSDAQARWSAYKTAREIGAMSAEEVRRFENLGPKAPDEDYSPIRATPQPADHIATTRPTS